MTREAARRPAGTADTDRVFLFADIEGSTRAWQSDPEGMPALLREHDEIVRRQVGDADGVVFKHTGDGFCAVFDSAEQALVAAVGVQRALRSTPLRIRIGVHAGPAEYRDGDYFGLTLNRTARIMSAAHGGQTLVSAVIATQTPPTSARLVDLGDHRLRDLREPERLFQLSAPGLDEDFPPLRAAPTATPVPRPRDPIVGRQAEVREVTDLLDQAAIVTLTGTGGCGKTRLAIQVADHAEASFADGAAFVDLTAVNDADNVAAAIARGVGAPEDVGRALDSVARLRHFLGHRRVLLVLDNCEHLIDPVGALTEELVDHCPRLTVLVTSREPLSVRGERVVRVPSLSPDDGYELFLRRATESGARLSGTEQERRVVDRICGSLDGIPLALELAAARVGQLGLTELADLLDDRFRLLTGSSRRPRQRQRTLEATMDWSHDLLDGVEQELFRRLGVFNGTFDLDAATAVWTGHDRGAAAEVLSSLVAKSLIVAETDEQPTRYRLLETTRLYALDRLLESGESEEILERHFDWCESLCPRALSTPSEVETHRALLEPEEDNLRAAIDWAIDAGHTDRAVALVGRIWGLWVLRMEFDEVRAWLALAPTVDDRLPLEDRLNWRRGQMTVLSAEVNFESGIRSFEIGDEILALAPVGHEARVHARLWQAQGLAYLDPAQARRLLDEARQIPAARAPEWAHWLDHVEGLTYLHDLDIERAATTFAAASAMDDVDMWFARRYDQMNLVAALWMLGRYDEAAARLASARDVVGTHDAWYEQLVLGYLEVLVPLGLGQPVQAHQRLQALVELTEDRYASTSGARAFAVGGAAALVEHDDPATALALAEGARVSGLAARYEPLWAWVQLVRPRLCAALSPAEVEAAEAEAAKATGPHLFERAAGIAQSAPSGAAR